MTVSATKRVSHFAGNGSATAFTFPFKVLNKAHFRLVKTDAEGAETTLVVDTDYTMTGIGSASGVIVTYPIKEGVANLAAGEQLTGWRVTPLLQEVDLYNGDALDAEVIESALDQLTHITQELAEDVARTPKGSITDGEIDGEALFESVQTAIVTATQAATTAEAAATTANVASQAASQAASMASTAATSAENATTSAAAAQTAAESAAQTAADAQALVEGSSHAHANLAALDLIPAPSGANMVLKTNSAGTGWGFGPDAAAPTWGSITGTLTDQADLVSAMNAALADKADSDDVAASVAALMPQAVTITTVAATGGAMTKKTLNNLTATTAGTIYFPADLADGEWVWVRLASGAGLHTLDCSNISGVSLGKTDGTTATSLAFVASEKPYNKALKFRRVGSLIVGEGA